MNKDHPCGKGSVKWISTDWLAENLGRQEMLLLDVQPNVHDFIEEHLPGAVYLPEGLLRCTDNQLPAMYVSPAAAEQIFQRSGLKRGIPAVVYTGTGAAKGWGDGLEQTMMAYSLVRFGHDLVYVLDGGLDKWKAEDRPLTKEFIPVKQSDFTAEVQADCFIDYNTFKAIKDGSEVIVLDARPADAYEGQKYWIKPGHIPGAIHFPWRSLMDDGNPALLKPEQNIRAILERSDVKPDNTIVCTCGTGREATNEFILFKWYLDYPRVKIYEGSYTEWTAHPENPTVTGKKPR